MPTPHAIAYDDLRIDRYSTRSKIAKATSLVLALIALWALIGIARGAQLDRLDARNGRTVITNVAPSGQQVSTRPDATTDGPPMELILGAISIALILIGVVVRAATVDVFHEMAEEDRGEAARVDRRMRRAEIRHRLTSARLQRVSRDLDNAPKRLSNQLGVQRNALGLLRGRRAAGRPQSEGTWSTAEQVRASGATDPAKLFDSAVLDEAAAVAHLETLRLAPAAHDADRPLRMLRAARAAERLSELTGQAVALGLPHTPPPAAPERKGAYDPPADHGPGLEDEERDA